MPDSRPVADLAQRLRAALSVPRASANWAHPDKPMQRMAWEVKQDFGGDDGNDRPPQGDMLAAVRRFIGTRKADSFTDLKYVCYGVSVPLGGDAQRLIDHPPLFEHLLALVAGRRGQSKQFRRCYQALLAAYFGFEHSSGASAAAGQNWLQLRAYLAQQLNGVIEDAQQRNRSPDWLRILSDHRNLLGDKPCERYTAAFRRGDRKELADVCAGLGIESASWVWHEAVMAYVHEVVRSEDRPYRHELGTVLDVVDGADGEHRLPAAVATSAAALLVARYADCKDRPEHAQLRDVSLRCIGNPWLATQAWDAAVNSEPARKMVESWLKRRLISDFFEVLAQDGAADVRRLDYWLKWEPHISDMWFVLGGDAQRNQSAVYQALRERMAGRDRALTGVTDSGNNAFVMQIGPLYVVEFGMTGNACMAFTRAAFVIDIEKPSINIHEFRRIKDKKRLIHRGAWEQDFDVELRDLLSGMEVPTAPVAPRASSSEVGESAGAPSAQTGSRSPLPAPAAIWPSFKPPREQGRIEAEVQKGLPPSKRSTASVDPNKSGFAGVSDPRQSTSWEENLGQLRGHCLAAGLPYKDGRQADGLIVVSLHDRKKFRQIQDLARHLGFNYVHGQGLIWRQNAAVSAPAKPAAPVATSPLKAPGAALSDSSGGGQRELTVADLRKLRELCRSASVPFVDHRDKGGALWVLITDSARSPTLVSWLERQRFRFKAGKGYYYEGGD